MVNIIRYGSKVMTMTIRTVDVCSLFSRKVIMFEIQLKNDLNGQMSEEGKTANVLLDYVRIGAFTNPFIWDSFG